MISEKHWNLLRDKLGPYNDPDKPVAWLVSQLRLYAERLEAELADAKRALAEPDDDEGTLREALDRSDFDLGQCIACDKPVVCVPDGLPMCVACAKS